MSDLLSALSAMFDQGAPPDESGALASLRSVLAHEALGELFLAETSGDVLALDPPADAKLPKLLRPLLAALPAAAGSLVRVQRDGRALLVLRCTDSINGRAGLLGIHRAAAEIDLSEAALCILCKLAPLVWAAYCRSTELRESQTRVRQLQAEHDTLKRTHNDTVTSVLQEREEHLQEKRRHIAQLELEVMKRSAALQEALARAEHANRAKSDFLANMSHEIRTPMTAILGFSESLLDASVSESERAELVRTIQRNGQHLLELINDILDLSKIEAGRLEAETVACSPGRIVADVAMLLRGKAETKRLSLELAFIGPIPETINTDPTRLRQILFNLMGNAIKFTEVGCVRVEVRLIRGTTDLIEFSVIDSGIGISSEGIERLFQPFTQADTSTTRRFGGTGLGLTISRRLATLLGGTLTVKSAIGQGSTFSVSVATGDLNGVKLLESPRESDFAPKSTAPSAAAPTRAATAKPLAERRILVAEDGPDNQRLITFILRKYGATVEIAENGLIAVEKAQAARSTARPFDVILMDMQMPELDGYGATSTLRRAGYRGPIIALTANAMAGDREKCLDAGCDDFATKPIDRAALLATIEKALVVAASEPALTSASTSA